MELHKLLASLGNYHLTGNDKFIIQGIIDDSRKAKNNFLFVAVPGIRVDAHDFVNEVYRKGVKAIVGQMPFPALPDGEFKTAVKAKNASYVCVKNSRKALSLLAGAWYDNPAEKLTIIGITGTDGKTTTAHLSQHILKTKEAVGLISTVKAITGRSFQSTGAHVTNPEPLILQSILNKMVDSKLKYAVLEVTSIGIDQGRVEGIEFDTVALTNITNEHLDYHKSFNIYRDTKLKLFENTHHAIMNKDDDQYDYMRKRLRKNTQLITYSIIRDANYCAIDMIDTAQGTNFTIKAEGSFFPVHIKAHGGYNVANTLAAVAIARVYKVSWDGIIKALASAKLPSGRLTQLPNKKGLEVIIDYAHTPNGMENLLKMLATRKRGKLISIVSAEGERDPEKRAAIGRIAAAISDHTILNPIDTRSEKPEDIAEKMAKGAKQTGRSFEIILSRKTAIAKAIAIARKGDTVVITGKGHESSMNVGGSEIPWSDRKVAQEVLNGQG